MSGRNRQQHSYGHHIEAMSYPDCYRISWTVDRYYNGSRLRHPKRYQRDTDTNGAKRFAKRWNLPNPEVRSVLP